MQKNRVGKVVDSVAEQGYDKDGVPFFTDLYLDLVVYLDGTIIEDDMDELQSTKKIVILRSNSLT